MVELVFLCLMHFNVQILILDEFCKESDIEEGAVSINLSFLTICIISIYRSATGNFLHFYITSTPFTIAYTATQMTLLFVVTLI